LERDPLIILGGLQWNTEVNLGNALTWAMLLIGLITNWVRMGDRIKSIESWIKSHQAEVIDREKLGQQLNLNVALLTQSLTDVARRLEHIESAPPWDGMNERRGRGKKDGD
jgi:hypothetical protein